METMETDVEKILMCAAADRFADSVEEMNKLINAPISRDNLLAAFYAGVNWEARAAEQRKHAAEATRNKWAKRLEEATK